MGIDPLRALLMVRENKGCREGAAAKEIEQAVENEESQKLKEECF